MSRLHRVVAAAGIATVSALSFVNLANAAVLFQASTEDGTEQKFFNNKSSLSLDAKSFFGSVNVNNTNDDVNVTTNTPVTIGDGYSNIKPDSGTLTSLIFRPTNPNAYEDMFFRGQINDSSRDTTFDGIITATILDNHGVTTVVTFSGVSDHGDFSPLGFRATLPGETIQSVTISLDSTGVFKEFKQVDFSPAVPEPSTWAMMILGFAGVGFMTYRRKNKMTPSAASQSRSPSN
jgi:hypothetical protein